MFARELEGPWGWGWGGKQGGESGEVGKARSGRAVEELGSYSK